MFILKKFTNFFFSFNRDMTLKRDLKNLESEKLNIFITKKDIFSKSVQYVLVNT